MEEGCQIFNKQLLLVDTLPGDKLCFMAISEVACTCIGCNCSHLMFRTVTTMKKPYIVPSSIAPCTDESFFVGSPGRKSCTLLITSHYRTDIPLWRGGMDYCAALYRTAFHTHTITTFSTLGNLVMHLDDSTMISQTEGTTFGDLQSRLHCHVVIWKR